MSQALKIYSKGAPFYHVWAQQIEQLELRLDELEATRAERTVAAQTPVVPQFFDSCALAVVGLNAVEAHAITDVKSRADKVAKPGEVSLEIR